MFDERILSMTVSELEHHGVKGQKWGVRRKRKYGTRHDKGHEGSTARKSKIEKLDKKFISDKATLKAYMKVYNHMANKMNSEGLKELNSNPKWEGKNLNNNPEIRDGYMKEYTRIMERYLNEGNKKLVGSSASGRYSLKFIPSDTGIPSYAIVENKKIKHGIDRYYVKAITNELGQVDRVEIVDDVVEMSDLHHHGVKGQKWGVRKAIKRAEESHRVSSESKKRERSWRETYKKRGEMSTSDLKRAVERLRLENELNRLATEATASQRAKSRAIMKNFEGIDISQNSGAELRKKLAKAAGQAAVKAATL